MKDGKPIEYLNIRLRPGEWDKLKAALKEDEYDETPQGVHDFLFDIVNEDKEADSDDEEENEDEPERGNPAIDKLFDFISKNPDAVKNAAGLGKTVLTDFLKKKMGL